MSESLRDQLLKAGFKASPQPKPHRRVQPEPEPRKPRAPTEPDLAQAFALRARADRAEREGAELGVVMHGGRALVIARDVALQVQAIAPEVVALLVDPSVPAEDDGVPDDLMW